MKTYFYSFLCFIILSALAQGVHAQGCVAVKNMSSCSLNFGEESKGFQFSANYRYFRSFKHFRGTHEEVERVQEGTEVINDDNSYNFSVGYTFNNRFSLALIVPQISINRSSMYEHYGNSEEDNPARRRFTTHSEGLGDIRLIGYMNTLPRYQTGNLVVGLGVKVPTGNYNARDHFYRLDDDGAPYTEFKAVDQSIQLGDGGWGIITEVDFTQKIRGKFFGYLNAMYMMNPRNTNGTLRSTNLTRNAQGQPILLSNEMSVTDQYMLRGGVRYVNERLQVSLGYRKECIPVEDLLGKSDGFRRPGYVISIEPSASYTFAKRNTITLNFPFVHVGDWMPFDNFINGHLLERNRTRSVIDRKRGNDSEGKPIHGDAAFADWLVSVTYTYRLPL
jgi:hypothetical protein